MRVSIITACKNSEETIEDTILSIVNQTYPDIEHVIIDGKSTDSTLAIIDKYKANVSFCISEKDKSMYEAMNKGVKMATGNLILILNSDDALLNSDTVECIVELAKTATSPLIAFKIHIVNSDTDENYYKGYDKVDKLWLFKDCICQQALLYRPEVFQKVGYFDEKCKVVGDYDWLLRAILHHDITFTYFDLPIVRFRQQGIFSGDEKIHKIYLQEHEELIKKYFGIYKSKLLKFIFKYLGSLTKIAGIRVILNKFI